MCLCTEIFAFEEPRNPTKSAHVPFPSGACLMRKAKVRANLARRWSPSDSVETAFLHCICCDFVYVCILFLKQA